MKINELKRIAEENNYEFSKEFGYFCFEKRNHTNHIDIRGDVENRIWITTGIICDDADFNMIKASVKFAETPIDEREDEKKFRLMHRWLFDRRWFLCLYRNECGEMGVSRYTENVETKDLGKIQVHFTKKEIDEIKEKYNTELSDFEIVEVEE